MKPNILLAGAAALALAACTSMTPVHFHNDHLAQIIVGKTTHAEVDRLMGVPDRVLVNKRTQARLYDYEYLDQFGYRSEMTLAFDDSGVVSKKTNERLDP